MKKRWERAKDILFTLICVYVFVRIALPEQYMLLRGGVLGKRILWEESCRDTFYGVEDCKVFLYQSHDGKKTGMISLRKGQFLLWNRYVSYCREEVNDAEKIWFSRTNAYRLRDLWKEFPNAQKVPYEGGQVVFQEHYRNHPDGWQNGSVLRHVYCGRVDREQPPEWFQKLEQEAFRYRWTDGDYIYFYMDSPIQVDYSEKTPLIAGN